MKKYNHILLYEEGSIDAEKHKETLEALGIYLLPYTRTPSNNMPELLNVGVADASISAIGFEVESERDYIEEGTIQS